MTDKNKPHRRIENGVRVLDLGEVRMSLATKPDSQSKPDHEAMEKKS